MPTDHAKVLADRIAKNMELLDFAGGELLHYLPRFKRGDFAAGDHVRHWSRRIIQISEDIESDRVQLYSEYEKKR